MNPWRLEGFRSWQGPASWASSQEVESSVCLTLGKPTCFCRFPINSILGFMIGFYKKGGLRYGFGCVMSRSPEYRALEACSGSSLKFRAPRNRG